MRYPEIDRVVQRSLKQVGKDDAWIRYLGGSYETAETIGDYRVEFSDESVGDKQCIIWNHDTPCVTVYIHAADKTAVLNSLYYSPDCIIQGNMRRGDGTRAMLEFAFSLAKDLGAQRIQLTDQTTIDCESTKVKLGPFSLIRNGKTWYEKHFGFKPLPEYAEEYKHAKLVRSQLPDLENLKQMPCEYFTRKVTNDLMSRVGLQFESIVWEKTLC